MVDVTLTQDDLPLQYFASNFADRLKDFTTYFRHKDLPEPARTCKSTLSESVDGSFTEEHGHLLSYDQQGCGEFEFSNRFEAEEVEWILNKPYIAGRTALHVEVINQRAHVLEALLKHKGNFFIIANYHPVILCLSNLQQDNFQLMYFVLYNPFRAFTICIRYNLC